MPYLPVLLKMINVLKIYAANGTFSPALQTERLYFSFGEGLVSFCELDINPLVEKVKELDAIPLTNENYDAIRKGVFGAIEYFKDKHEYAYIFMVGALNNILLTPVVVKDEDEMFNAVFNGIEEADSQLLSHLRECILYLDSIVGAI